MLDTQLFLEKGQLQVNSQIGITNIVVSVIENMNINEIDFNSFTVDDILQVAHDANDNLDYSEEFDEYFLSKHASLSKYSQLTDMFFKLKSHKAPFAKNANRKFI